MSEKRIWKLIRVDSVDKNKYTFNELMGCVQKGKKIH